MQETALESNFFADRRGSLVQRAAADGPDDRGAAEGLAAEFAERLDFLSARLMSYRRDRRWWFEIERMQGTRVTSTSCPFSGLQLAAVSGMAVPHLCQLVMLMQPPGATDASLQKGLPIK